MSKRRSRLGVLSAVVLFIAVAAVAALVEKATRTAAGSVAQGVADAAALAGASALLDAPDEEGLAEARVREYIELNATSQPFDVSERLVEVDGEAGTVEVHVVAKAYGLPVFVAYILGVERVDVPAMAVAEGRGMRCFPLGESPEGTRQMRCEGMLEPLRLRGEDRERR